MTSERYKVVSALDVNKFNEILQDHISKGWTLVGELKVSASISSYEKKGYGGNRDTIIVYAQMMKQCGS